jgi:transposase
MNRVSAHPLNLRLRVLQAIDDGTPLVDAAQEFGVSLSSIRLWLRQRREQGHIVPKPSSGGRPALKETTLLAHLPALLSIHPHAGARHLCKVWNAQSTHMQISYMTMARVLKQYKEALMNTQPTNDSAEPTQHCHQVIANNQVIYEGDDWARAFLEASKNPEYGEIVAVHDGVPGAQWGPSLAPDALRDQSEARNH